MDKDEIKNEPDSEERKSPVGAEQETWITNIKERLKSARGNKTNGAESQPSQVPRNEHKGGLRYYSQYAVSRRFCGSSSDRNNNLGSLPVESQEKCLMRDIFFLLFGVDGEYVHLKATTDKHGRRDVYFDPIPDVSLKESMKQIAPVVSDYAFVHQFVHDKAEFCYGRVNQALSAAIEEVLDHHEIQFVKLESQFKKKELTLRQLLYNLQPLSRTTKLLASVATAVNKSGAMGGEVLSLLHDMTVNAKGNENARSLLLELTQKACVPYMTTLEKWIYQGKILDPYGEFLVQDNEKMEREQSEEFYCSDYWSKKYTITKTPTFLKQSSERILRTGKYLNVILQCGENMKCPQAEPLVYSLEKESYLQSIEKAYNFASKTLLDVLLEEKDLKGRLRSVKRYFMLEQGDLIVTLMDQYEGELKKQTKDVEPNRLDSLLQMALRTTQANCDPYKDNLSATLLPISLNQQMLDILSIRDFPTGENGMYLAPQYEDMNLEGWESFCFMYHVNWPLSLVLNANTMLRYQMIFRHLFFSKHVEKLLCNVWISNKVVKLFSPQASRMYAPAFMLRQRMLNFVQNLEYYMMVEVIERSWRTFLNKMEKVSNLDEVLTYHQDFLNECLANCMLLNPELLNLVSQLLRTCIDFTDFIQSPEITAELSPSESFEQKIARFDLKFNTSLLCLMSKLLEIGKGNTNELLLNILYRLDLNGFYRSQLNEVYRMQQSSTERQEDNELV